MRICISAFSSEEIETAKCLLFQSIPTQLRKIKRKPNNGKRDKDLFDVIELFKIVDLEKIPVFVAHDLNKLPPITFDHVDVTRLLKDILKLQNEVKLIQNTYVTNEQLIQTKEDLMRINNIEDVVTEVVTDKNVQIDLNPTSHLNNSYRNINLKRGAFLGSFNYDSGPFGLPHMTLTENDPNTVNLNTATEKLSCDHPSPLGGKSPCTIPVAVYSPEERVEATTAVSTPRGPSKAERTHERPEPTLEAVRPTAVPANIPKAADIDLPTRSFVEVARAAGIWKESNKSDEWVEVQRKRHRNRFIGKKGIAITTSDCKFKAADLQVPLFINNVDKGVSPVDIADYIKTKTQVEVMMEKIEMKQQKLYDAYKIFVPKHKLELFMEDKMWPEGITFRRFIDFSKRNKNNKPNGCKSNKNSINK